jgi:FkbM family methyltransferase
MKDINVTVLEAINYVISQHPNLAPSVESLCQAIQGKNNLDYNFLLSLNRKILSQSKSQLRQDIFVLSESDFKKNGYFIEFGGTNGIDLSNSYILEKEYGWSGIVAEPGKKWHQELFKNRRCIVDTRCVWRASGEKLLFNQPSEAELSTIDTFSNSDNHSKTREGGEKFYVDTISLVDLLDHHAAPKHIDYLSIDTEGSEYEILSAFDFQKYKIKIITCEHNYTENRQKINSLLTGNGYEQKYADISFFDDWYVLK